MSCHSMAQEWRYRYNEDSARVRGYFYDSILIPNYYYQWGNQLLDENGDRWKFELYPHPEPFISYITNKEFLLPLTAPFTMRYEYDWPHDHVNSTDSSMLGWRDAMQRVDVPYPLTVIGLAAEITPTRIGLLVDHHAPALDSLLLMTFSGNGTVDELLKIPWYPDDTVAKLRWVKWDGLFNPTATGCAGGTDDCYGSYQGIKEYFLEKPVVVADSCYIGSTQWGSFWNHAETQFTGHCMTGGVNSVVPLYKGDEMGWNVISQPRRTLEQYGCPMWDSVQCMFKDFNGDWHYVKRIPRIQMWLIIDTTNLGIGQVEPEYGLEVYPNPATTMVRVKADNPIGYIMVYDQTGRIMYRNNHYSQEIIMNVGHWPQGVYVMNIHLKGSTKQYIQKLVVSH